jgi:hypothetical protein
MKRTRILALMASSLIIATSAVYAQEATPQIEFEG